MTVSRHPERTSNDACRIGDGTLRDLKHGRDLTGLSAIAAKG
jgi:hypothetical protein